MPAERNLPRDFRWTLPRLIAAMLSEKVTASYRGAHATLPLPGTQR